MIYFFDINIYVSINIEYHSGIGGANYLGLSYEFLVTFVTSLSSLIVSYCNDWSSYPLKYLNALTNSV